MFLLTNKKRSVILNHERRVLFLTIGNRIELIRKKKKLSRRAFAEKFGVSESVIVNIEFDRLKKPDQKEALYRLICQEFDINENWLRTGEGEMEVELSKEEYITDFVSRILKTKEDSFKKRYINMLSRLDEKGWEALEQVANAMGQLKED